MSFVSFYKKPQPRGYSTRDYLVEDTSPDSPNYFQVTQFSDTLGGGRYIMKLKGNGLNLRADSSIEIEVIDAEGENMFAEVTSYVDRFKITALPIRIDKVGGKGIWIKEYGVGTLNKIHAKIQGENR